MKKITAIATVVIGGLVLANCGGGSTTRTTKTSTPATSADQIKQISLEIAGDVLVSAARFDGNASGNLTSNDATVDAYNVNVLTDIAFSALVVTTDTFFCSSPDPANVDTGNGSITITRDDKDPAGRSAGDTVTTKFNNCVQFGQTLNGTRSNSVDALTGTPFAVAPWSLSTTRSTDMTSAGTNRSTVEKSTSTVKVSSPDNLVNTQNVTGEGTTTTTRGTAAPVTRNQKFTINTVTDLNTFTTKKDLDIQSSTDTGATRSVKTVQPLQGSMGGPPDSGVLEIKEVDAAAGVNRLVRVTAQPNGQAQVEIDNNGDGTIDTTVTTSWFAVIGIGVGSCPAASCDLPAANLPVFNGAPIPSSGSGRPVSPVPPVTTPPTGGGFTPPPGGFTPPPGGFTPPPGGFVPPGTTTIPGTGTTTNTNTQTG